jgi:glycosyltransferase involved in cell wall biosynthesis
VNPPNNVVQDDHGTREDELRQTAELPPAIADGRQVPLAYISHYFPALTQTFVYREIQALEELGWSVQPFSIRRPTKGISDEARELAARTFYVLPINWVKLLWRQVFLSLAHPLRYLGLLLFVISRPGESLRARVHGLTHFFGGMYLVPELRRAGIRHFHAHFGMNPATLAMVASRYLGIPFSMTIHARDLFVDTALLPTKLREAKFVATISEYNRGILSGMTTPEAAERIHIVHCGIDLRRFSSRPAVAEVGPKTGSPVHFVAVGRLVPKKGYIYLVEAARLLKDRSVPFEVTLVGGGPDRQLLEERVASLDVGDRVKLLGPMPQEKLLPFLKEADCFVLPCVTAEDGDKDGIPVSLMEAMAFGIPCLSTTLSGIPELIEHEEEGLLVSEKDARALADALERLARDSALRERLGKAGRKKVEAGFSLQAQVRELDRLFRQ